MHDGSTLERIAHYRITRKLGEGGMGVVYAAHDERLDREVAIKMLRAGSDDDTSRLRLWREARAAAAVNHPNMVQLYEVGDVDGELFIAMELLDGESLAARLDRGPLPLGEACQIALAVLGALDPLHKRGIIHRDLKPSNIFITPHGVKLLDFGVARPFAADAADAQLTLPGVVVGTPHYLAPEQFETQTADPRSDLFSLAAVLYEMLSGKKAFNGRNIVEVLHAVATQEPPPLGGSIAIANVDRVLRRALSKLPARRHANAESMASDLRAALVLTDDTGTHTRAQPLRRMIVLPFRILRPDPETDFLARSLPDAISASLSGLESILMRSTLSVPGAEGESPNLEEIAARADVDTVLTGTLLRAGDQLRVVTQLVEAPQGSLIWAQTSQISLGDVFQLQDALTRRIVESLAVPLSARDRRVLQRDVPANADAYALYLRANDLATHPSQWAAAHGLYLECLERDPDFAPAWARLGRLHRVIAHYGGEQADHDFERAQQAFRRALELNPDLSLAHNLSTHLEVDLGRARQAMVRLLERATQRPADADLYAGLVQTCRYCGLLDASIAAHEHAVRLDPRVRTSVNHAYLMKGDYAASIATNIEDPPFVNGLAYDLWGKRDEAVALMLEVERRPLPRVMRGIAESMRLVIEERPAGARPVLAEALRNLSMRDPCGNYYFARTAARVGDLDRAMAMLKGSVEGGFTCFEFMARDPWLDALRGSDEFRAVLRNAEVLERQARAAFVEAGGERVLSVRG